MPSGQVSLFVDIFTLASDKSFFFFQSKTIAIPPWKHTHKDNMFLWRNEEKYLCGSYLLW